MQWDENLLSRIRQLLVDDLEENERLFSDAELIEELENAESKNHVLYILYVQKAGKLVNWETSIKYIKAGGEELARLNAEELSKLALKQAEYYKKLWKEEGDKNENGSVILF